MVLAHSSTAARCRYAPGAVAGLLRQITAPKSPHPQNAAGENPAALSSASSWALVNRCLGRPGKAAPLVNTGARNVSTPTSFECCRPMVSAGNDALSARGINGSSSCLCRRPCIRREPGQSVRVPRPPTLPAPCRRLEKNDLQRFPPKTESRNRDKLNPCIPFPTYSFAAKRCR